MRTRHMDINTAFPGKYFKAEEIPQPQVMQIARVAMEDVGDSTKPVMYFHNSQQGLVLNKTRAAQCAALMGNETDTWAGQMVTLTPATAAFQGKTVPAIAVAAGPAPATQPVTAAQHAQGAIHAQGMGQADVPSEDIPF